ncbi:BTB/POZ domain-containing protein 17-like isoform X1 [Anneissia japonica]|uniref:BTB/POZ domain-containing protein 17-like isoform X1 n=1 Tax=Anneissia japonica TaxID=1529436 RepID=UPI0014254C90|nr:BTB/POZ domain-containing protein 17-like isoform X1 [Anneissia japonica]
MMYLSRKIKTDPRVVGYRAMAAGGGGNNLPFPQGNFDIPALQAIYMAPPHQPQPPVSISPSMVGQETSDETEIQNLMSGMDCHGDERLSLSDMEKFYNNSLLSDIKLRIGENTFFAHKLILVRSSEVFERMLSADWIDPNKGELELVEEPECVKVFPSFLRFLYGCHIVLTAENALPALMLADKYNVADLRRVCIHFAMTNIIPKLQLKDVFHIWYQYATKCYHQRLIANCIQALSPKADDIMSMPEWSHEWLNLDKEQLIEFLRSSDLTIRNEITLFYAVVKWIESPTHPDRLQNSEKLLRELMHFIRFPMMTPDHLDKLEHHKIIEQHKDLFLPLLLQAYKFNSLPLEHRASIKDFTTSSFLLRNYTDLRWDKRIVLTGYSQYIKVSEVMPRFSTRSSAYPHTSWDWEIKIYPKGSSSNNDDFRAILYSNVVLDQPRPMEYLLSLVNNNAVLRTVSGKKNFSKTRYQVDTEIDKKVTLEELMTPGSPLLVNDCVILQVSIKPLQ